MRYFDVYHGVELKPRVAGGNLVLDFPIEAKGYGAILATNVEPDAALQSLLSKMKQMTSTPLLRLLARMEGSAAAIGPD